jgi:hypothetical protein
MSIGIILLIIVVIALLGGFSGSAAGASMVPATMVVEGSGSYWLCS